MKKKKGKDFESAKLRITRGYIRRAACKADETLSTVLPPSAGAAVLHPLFLCFLVQELADAADDVVAFVGHLRVEVDVRDAQFLGVHPGDEVLHVAVVAMAFAEHHHTLWGAGLFEHKGVGLAPFGLIGLLGTALVEFELVGGKANHVGHGHVFLEAILREFRCENVSEEGHPFRVGSFLFLVVCGSGRLWRRFGLRRSGLSLVGFDAVLDGFHHF